MTTKRMSIDKLEALLNREEETPLEILPNGEVRMLGTKRRTKRKPLTLRENLGGEYACV